MKRLKISLFCLSLVSVAIVLVGNNILSNSSRQELNKPVYLAESDFPIGGWSSSDRS
ncbi:MAG: hypothetical protein ACFBSE_11865 [Prochloraceae cyanobacterium]